MAKGDTMSHRRIQDLNPSPLTSNLDFLRNGCLVRCFPFVLSSQTESAALGAREEPGGWGGGLGPTPYSTAELPVEALLPFEPDNSLL